MIHHVYPADVKLPLPKWGGQRYENCFKLE